MSPAAIPFMASKVFMPFQSPFVQTVVEVLDRHAFSVQLLRRFVGHGVDDTSALTRRAGGDAELAHLLPVHIFLHRPVVIAPRFPTFVQPEGITQFANLLCTEVLNGFRNTQPLSVASSDCRRAATSASSGTFDVRAAFCSAS